MLTTYEQRSRLKLAATVVSVLVIAGIVLLADHIKADKSTSSVGSQTATTATTATTAQSSSDTPSSSTNATTTPTTTTTTPSTSSSSSSSGYKDGTYTASSNYYVPHGQEQIKVSLTIQNGAVTSASIQNSEGDNDSARYQEDFAASYKSYVVGHKISGLQISIVAGASDTSQGFNDAVSQIQSQAKA